MDLLDLRVKAVLERLKLVGTFRKLMLDVTYLQLFGVLLVHHELDLCFKLVLVAKALIFQPHDFVFIMVDEDFKLADFIRKLLNFRLLLCY